mmetsp:Transcript_8444/g.24264  ORF Transcript_8444/g.24264 Transcript_8444/m.24264 type:complete len:395 (+) Transcript_8444:401-1585(+)
MRGADAADVAQGVEHRLVPASEDIYVQARPLLADRLDLGGELRAAEDDREHAGGDLRRGVDGRARRRRRCWLILARRLLMATTTAPLRDATIRTGLVLLASEARGPACSEARSAAPAEKDAAGRPLAGLGGHALRPMVGKGLRDVALRLAVRLQQRSNPKDVFRLLAMHPAPWQLPARARKRLRRNVLHGVREGLPVDVALPANRLAEEEGAGIALAGQRRKVQVQEDPISQARIRCDASEMLPAEEKLVGAPSHPIEVHFLQRRAVRGHPRVAEHPHEPCHQRQERCDPNAGAHRDEDLAAERRRRRRSERPVESDSWKSRPQPRPAVHALLRERGRPIADPRNDEVHGVVLLAGDDGERVPLPGRQLRHVDVCIHAGPEAPQDRRLAHLQDG